ncbi:Stp1/IreP family PP2C-type Ser/Thr phosphatase [bacterium]|nr:Stp1/IreP family PP2C-type Ser/Thr phosphatase [bacterium]
MATLPFRKPIKSFDFGNSSDVGHIRTENEDYFGYFTLPVGELFIVCDGMGGHVGGKRASQLAVQVISQSVKESVELDPVIILSRAIEHANAAILSEVSLHTELKGMGTTCVLLLLQPGPHPKAWRAHVGDSRLYLIRAGEIKQLSNDHSLVGEMLERGLITEMDAAQHPKRNVITRALGVKDKVEPDVAELQVYRGDRFILCSDGISGPIPSVDLQSHSVGRPPQELAEILVRLANERGGEDNSTVQVVDVLAGPKAPSIVPNQSDDNHQDKSIHSIPLIGGHFSRFWLISIVVALILAATATIFVLEPTWIPNPFGTKKNDQSKEGTENVSPDSNKQTDFISPLLNLPDSSALKAVEDSTADKIESRDDDEGDGNTTKELVQ